MLPLLFKNKNITLLCKQAPYFYCQACFMQTENELELDFDIITENTFADVRGLVKDLADMPLDEFLTKHVKLPSEKLQELTGELFTIEFFHKNFYQPPTATYSAENEAQLRKLLALTDQFTPKDFNDIVFDDGEFFVENLKYRLIHELINNIPPNARSSVPKEVLPDYEIEENATLFLFKDSKKQRFCELFLKFTEKTSPWKLSDVIILHGKNNPASEMTYNELRGTMEFLYLMFTWEFREGKDFNQFARLMKKVDDFSLHQYTKHGLVEFPYSHIAQRIYQRFILDTFGCDNYIQINAEFPGTRNKNHYSPVYVMQKLFAKGTLNLGDLISLFHACYGKILDYNNFVKIMRHLGTTRVVFLEEKWFKYEESLYNNYLDAYIKFHIRDVGVFPRMLMHSEVFTELSYGDVIIPEIPELPQQIYATANALVARGSTPFCSTVIRELELLYKGGVTYEEFTTALEYVRVETVFYNPKNTFWIYDFYQNFDDIGLYTTQLEDGCIKLTDDPKAKETYNTILNSVTTTSVKNTLAETRFLNPRVFEKYYNKFFLSGENRNLNPEETIRKTRLLLGKSPEKAEISQTVMKNLRVKAGRLVRFYNQEYFFDKIKLSNIITKYHVLYGPLTFEELYAVQEYLREEIHDKLPAYYNPFLYKLYKTDDLYVFIPDNYLLAKENYNKFISAHVKIEKAVYKSIINGLTVRHAKADLPQEIAQVKRVNNAEKTYSETPTTTPADAPSYMLLSKKLHLAEKVFTETPMPARTDKMTKMLSPNLPHLPENQLTRTPTLARPDPATNASPSNLPQEIEKNRTGNPAIAYRDPALLILRKKMQNVPDASKPRPRTVVRDNDFQSFAEFLQRMPANNTSFIPPQTATLPAPESSFYASFFEPRVRITTQRPQQSSNRKSFLRIFVEKFKSASLKALTLPPDKKFQEYLDRQNTLHTASTYDGDH